MEENELKLAPAKTEAVIITGLRRRDNIFFEIGGNVVIPNKYGKYQGIWLNDRLRFYEHIRQTVRKAERLVTALLNLCQTLGD